VAQQVEGGDLLGDARRMGGRELIDAVAETDVLGALAGGGEEYFRCRRVRVLFEEVVLHLPRVIVAELVGQLQLIEGVVVELAFVVLLPGTRQLQLIENPELHSLLLLGDRRCGPGSRSGSRAAVSGGTEYRHCPAVSSCRNQKAISHAVTRSFSSSRARFAQARASGGESRMRGSARASISARASRSDRNTANPSVRPLAVCR